MLNYPDTPSILDALLAYLQAMTFVNSSSLVYTQPSSQYPDGGVQEGEIKIGIADLTASGGVVGEIYLNDEESKRHVFGGVVRETQRFYILSLVSLDDAKAAERLIAQVRDANMAVVQLHVTLGGTLPNIVSARILPKSNKYVKVPRNSNRFYRGFLYEVEVVSDWLSVVGFTA